MIENLEPISAIQHWLNTPIGSYCGFPKYGSNIDTLLFKNSSNAYKSIDAVYNKIREDLGQDIYDEITNIEILSDIENYYIVISTKNEKVGVKI